MKMLIVGYYDKNNHGDDAYTQIAAKFFPGTHLVFVNADRLGSMDINDYNAILVGGGDMINNYFYERIYPTLKKCTIPKIAWSIGVPFEHLLTVKYLSYFDHVFVRNLCDVRKIQTIIGAHQAHYLPDAAWAFNKPLNVKRTFGKCGVCVVGNLINYPEIVDTLKTFLKLLSKNYRLTFYIFDKNEDTKLVNELVAHLGEENCDIELSWEMDAVRTIELFSTLDLAIVMKYHAHIFCMIAGTPFVSISTSRKTAVLMEECNLQVYQYKIPLDCYFNPTHINLQILNNITRLVINSSVLLVSVYNRIYQQYRILLQHTQILQLITQQTPLEYIQNNSSDPDTAARIICKSHFNCTETEYNYGLVEKLKNAIDKKSVIDEANDYFKTVPKIGNVLNNTRVQRCGCFQKPTPIVNGYININDYLQYSKLHYGGWFEACQKMATYGRSTGIICDMFVDATFHWIHDYNIHIGKIPYTSPWCGFIHHTSFDKFSTFNTKVLFEKLAFRQSLVTCKGLFVLNQPLGEYIYLKLKNMSINVPIYVFTHPIVKPTRYFSNNPKMIVNVGAWMRNPWTIYTCTNVRLPRAILIGKNMNNIIPPDAFTIKYTTNVPIINNKPAEIPITMGCRINTNQNIWVEALIDWLQYNNVKVAGYDLDTKCLYLLSHEKLVAEIRSMIDSVKIIQCLPNKEYEQLLTQNIIFLDLYDAAAVNTILECIVRHTPILVNKIPGTVAILGSKYPMFYTSVQEIPILISKKNIEKTRQYLKSMPKKIYQLDFFTAKLGNLINILAAN